MDNVNKKIAPELIDQNPREQEAIDRLMIDLDGTPTKAKLGANAILGVSLAVAKAAAEAVHLPLYRYLGGTSAKVLPVPMMNILNGGRHADNNVDFQEFMIQPWGATSFAHALRMGCETYHALKGVLKKKGYSAAIGDEGGFAPSLKSNEEALEVIAEAVKAAGYKLGKDIYVAIDPAASELWVKEKKAYSLFKSDPKTILSSEDMVKLWAGWIAKYPIRSLEDGMAENDWDGWKKLTDKLGKGTQLVGDDVFVTNTKFLEERHPDRHGQFDFGEGQPDRHADRDVRGGTVGHAERLFRGDLAPLGRNRRRHHRGYRGGDELRPDQNRRPGT